LLILGIQCKEFPYEGGLEVLSKLPKLEKTFPGDEDANALLDRPRRRGWELPQM
jgi:hypothetical protein